MAKLPFGFFTAYECVKSLTCINELIFRLSKNINAAFCISHNLIVFLTEQSNSGVEEIDTPFVAWAMQINDNLVSCHSG